MENSETLHRKHLEDPASRSLAKIGKPFVMPPDLKSS
jgi:hypothetical protein